MRKGGKEGGREGGKEGGRKRENGKDISTRERRGQKDLLVSFNF